MQLNSPAAASVPWGKRDSGTAHWNVKFFQICFNDNEFIKYLVYRELKTEFFFKVKSQMELCGALWSAANQEQTLCGAVGWQEKDKFNTLSVFLPFFTPWCTAIEEITKLRLNITFLSLVRRMRSTQTLLCSSAVHSTMFSSRIHTEQLFPPSAFLWFEGFPFVPRGIYCSELVLEGSELPRVWSLKGLSCSEFDPSKLGEQFHGMAKLCSGVMV